MSRNFKDPRIRTEGDKINCSLDELAEWERCYEDPIHFINTWCLVKGKKFTLYPHQEEIVRVWQDSNATMLLSARQMGISTVIALLALHEACFAYWGRDDGYSMKGSLCSVLSATMQSSSHKLDIIRECYLSLPMWLKPVVLIWEDLRIQFTTGEILAHSQAIAIGYGRDRVFIDDSSWFHSHYSFPIQETLARRGKIFMANTGKKASGFLTLLEAAEESENSRFHTMRISWDVHPKWNSDWENHQRHLLNREGGEMSFESQFVMIRPIQWIQIRGKCRE